MTGERDTVLHSTVSRSGLRSDLAELAVFDQSDKFSRRMRICDPT